MYSEAIILVAGAEPTDRETILQTVGDQCHVVASQTVEDALAHRTDEVDLVIAEIKSARLDGLDLMRRWKTRHASTPFVMLADRNDAASAVDAMKNGAADCVVKPIDADELRSAVLHLITSTSDSGVADGGSNGGMRRKSTIDIPPNTSLEDLERAAVEQALVQQQSTQGDPGVPWHERYDHLVLRRTTQRWQLAGYSDLDWVVGTAGWVQG